MNRLDYGSPETPEPDRLEYLEIDTARKRRWMGLVGYLLLYGAVAAVLVVLLARFTDSLLLAFGLVAFMVGYMALMGRWASKNIQDQDRRRG